MENNAYKMESREARTKRLDSSPPQESIGTLLNSIANFFNNEIRETIRDCYEPQTGLMFLDVHAAILTISEAFWDLRPLEGYKKFLETFVDDTDQGMKFSIIADRIHEWRNLLAHQWLGAAGHNIIYDYTISEGWKMISDRSLSINPGIYCKSYLNAFAPGGRIWDYEAHFNEEDLKAIKGRIVGKYLEY